jgi:hypothetical protein
VLSGDCFLFASDLTGRCGCAGHRLGGFALDGHAVGLFDGAQPGGDSGLAGGDGLAVAAAVGAFGQALAELLDLAEVGFSFVGVGGDGDAVPVLLALREIQRGYLDADRLMGSMFVTGPVRLQVPVIERACEVTRGPDRAEMLRFASQFMEFGGWVFQGRKGSGVRDALDGQGA